MKILNICALIFVIFALLKLRAVESYETTNEDSNSYTAHIFVDIVTKSLYAKVKIFYDLESKYNLYLEQLDTAVSTLLEAVQKKNKQLKDLFNYFTHIQIESQLKDGQQELADTPLAAIQVQWCNFVSCKTADPDDPAVPATFNFVEILDTLGDKMEKLNSSLKPQYDAFKNQLKLLLPLYDLLRSTLRFAVYNYPKSFRDEHSSASFRSLQESYLLFMQEIDTAHERQKPFRLANLIFVYCGIGKLKTVSKEDNIKVFKQTIQLMSQKAENLEDSVNTFLSTYYYLIKHIRDKAKTELENTLKHENLFKDNPFKDLINDFLTLFADEESYAQQMYEDSIKQSPFSTHSDIPKSYTQVTDLSHKSFHVKNAADAAKLFLDYYNNDLITRVFKPITKEFEKNYGGIISCDDIDNYSKCAFINDSNYSQIKNVNNIYGTVFADFCKSGSTYIDLQIKCNKLQTEMKKMERIFNNLATLITYIYSVISYYKQEAHPDSDILSTLKKTFYSTTSKMDEIFRGIH